LSGLVISKSTLGRSPTLLIQERSRKKTKMATVNDVSSLAAISSDTNILYILSVPTHYSKRVTKNMNFNSTLTTSMPPSSSCKPTTCHVTETAGIEAFFDSKN